MRVLFLNSFQKQCGVYQYGKRVADIYASHTNHLLFYYEAATIEDYNTAVRLTMPDVVIVNYHHLTMPWLGPDTISIGLKHLAIHHEGSKPDHIGFDGYFLADSTGIADDKNTPLPRPLFEMLSVSWQYRRVPVIGSFGFGFGHKGFGDVVRLVNEQFDEAVIRLHIPRAYYGDRNGESTAGVIPGCWAEMKKPGITLEITHDFLDDKALLRFLYGNDINVFLYHETHNSGLSSVIDYALSVHRPIAVNKTGMFRHINTIQPSICVEDRSLPDLIDEDGKQLQYFRYMWSNQALAAKIDSQIC